MKYALFSHLYMKQNMFENCITIHKRRYTGCETKIKEYTTNFTNFKSKKVNTYNFWTPSKIIFDNSNGRRHNKFLLKKIYTEIWRSWLWLHHLRLMPWRNLTYFVRNGLKRYFSMNTITPLTPILSVTRVNMPKDSLFRSMYLKSISGPRKLYFIKLLATFRQLEIINFY